MPKIIKILIPAGIAGLGVIFFVFNPAENTFFPKCLFHSITGYHCPGCGSQRAVHELLHLNIPGVFRNNFLFLPALLLIVYHLLRPSVNSLFRLNLPNVLYMKFTPWVILAIVLLFWILRNIPYYPFYLLSPN